MTVNSGATVVATIFLSAAILTSCGDKGPSSPAPESVNTAPQVGASAQLTQAAILQLSGSAIDETLPQGPLTIQWSQVSGPGTVVFADPSQIDTTATFTTAGTYVLRLTASDGEFSVSDDVTVVVKP